MLKLDPVAAVLVAGIVFVVVLVVVVGGGFWLLGRGVEDR